MFSSLARLGVATGRVGTNAARDAGVLTMRIVDLIPRPRVVVASATPEEPAHVSLSVESGSAAPAQREGSEHSTEHHNDDDSRDTAGAALGVGVVSELPREHDRRSYVDEIYGAMVHPDGTADEDVREDTYESSHEDTHHARDDGASSSSHSRVADDYGDAHYDYPLYFGKCRHCDKHWVYGASHYCKKGGKRYEAFDFHRHAFRDDDGSTEILHKSTATVADDSSATENGSVTIDKTQVRVTDAHGESVEVEKTCETVRDEDGHEVSQHCETERTFDTAGGEADEFSDDNDLIMSAEERAHTRQVLRTGELKLASRRHERDETTSELPASRGGAHFGNDPCDDKTNTLSRAIVEYLCALPTAQNVEADDAVSNYGQAQSAKSEFSRLVDYAITEEKRKDDERDTPLLEGVTQNGWGTFASHLVTYFESAIGKFFEMRKNRELNRENVKHYEDEMESNEEHLKKFVRGSESAHTKIEKSLRSIENSVHKAFEGVQCSGQPSESLADDFVFAVKTALTAVELAYEP